MKALGVREALDERTLVGRDCRESGTAWIFFGKRLLLLI